MLAFIFPGQGSQKKGMAKEIFDNFKIAREIFELASDTLSLDMKKLCFEDSDNKLNLTEFTQISILTVSFAYSKILDDFIKPNFVAGHSLGEYSALLSVDSLQFSETLRAVRMRGKFMQKATGEKAGSMIATIGPAEEVKKLINWHNEHGEGVLEVANYNSPNQTVLSGHTDAINNIEKDKFNLKFIPLKVSAPFHCSLMEYAKQKMEPIISKLKIKNPNAKIITNVNAKLVDDADIIRENLILQITKPVLWTQTIEEFKNQGVCKFVEVGPGNVLTRLIKKFDNCVLFNINSPKDFEVIN